MRYNKPIPKESSFKQFSENQAKRTGRKKSEGDRKPGVSSKIKKMFNDNSDDRNQKSESRGSNSGTRTTFSGKTVSTGNSYSRDGRDSNSRSKFSDRGDSRSTFSRGNDKRDSRAHPDTRRSDSRRPTEKHDRRNPSSRGKSFKEDRRTQRAAVKESYDAICMKCHKPCKVPFKPTQGKGVSCSSCFEKKAKDNDSQYGKKNGYLKSNEEPRKRWADVPHSMRGAERRSREGIKQRGFTKKVDNGQRFAETKSGRKELFDAVCMKCKAKCKVPFKPTGKMGVSCTNCYDKNASPFKAGKKKAGGKTFGQKINDSNKKKFGKKRY